ncbi:MULTISPECIES: metallopeptidase TldD-related protein [unclassified Caballeronia]|uniref:TldD/PmbA family protein n=1 Tax=unclassified Caballeronia TaxID=2646786 RepID=UPI00286167BE|nr:MULTISPECIES: metallopeptidase TldD-related protein [unclassified Caballeronia]MDR5753120.1 metallopeptidase TldD-related protein [Caballeronia sp. LZ024]MDR5842003.1 metallopeptidase TldD-related protein [Caballeronia sp. LZ031]
MTARAFDWHRHFGSLAEDIEARLREGEVALTSLSAEDSDFVRFNAGKVRQIGRVTQGKLTLRLIEGERQAYATLTICGDPAQDRSDIAETLAILRDGLRDAPDDPHLLIDRSPWTQSTRRRGTLPAIDALVRVVTGCAAGFDFVGFYAGGSIVRGFASSLGSRGWHEVENFNFSWSLCEAGGRAIKTTYAGDDWRDDVFASRVEQAAARMRVFERTPRVLSPGQYRAYLAPAALWELIGTASFTAFSARQQASGRSELHRLHAGEVSLDPRVTLTEDLGLDIAPRFNEDGYLRESVALIEQGRSAGLLVSARTAREHGQRPNGAPANEMPVTLSMQGGNLADADVLKALDTGLYVGNLWYVNFSDRVNCRLTGMTRFATFWVEHGEIVAPVEAMRFDDSLYRLLGSELERLGATPELMLSDWTWGERSTGGMKLPGLLARSFDLTL